MLKVSQITEVINNCLETVLKINIADERLHLIKSVKTIYFVKKTVLGNAYINK